MVKKRDQFIKHLRTQINCSEEFEELGEIVVVPFGSARNTFWTEKSDIDVNIQFPEHKEEDQKVLLMKLRNIVKKFAHKDTMQFIDAKRVKLWRFKLKNSKIIVDLSVNNEIGPAATELVKTYA